MKRVLTVIGARPQFIKAAPVSRAFQETEGITEHIVHTGQHFDECMSDVFFEELGIPAPTHHLDINSRTHGAMTGAMLHAIEALLLAEKPDWVLVYGDTNSTLAGALAAVKLHIPVAHVEAGLRSFNRRMPEEHNRVLTDHMADLLFTPTDSATANLQREGVPPSRIQQVGDVMYDAAVYFAGRVETRTTILSKHGLTTKDYILATVHRAENTDNGSRLRAIITALDEVARHQAVVLPLHPRTRAALTRERISPKFIHVIEPVGYLDMVALESNASVIATDSGGVQKEAYFHGVPCVTLREETEWVELVEMGWNHLAPPGSADIVKILRQAIASVGRAAEPYGDGNAAVRIARQLV
ncbi:MAG: UDP-N-acetylglucosamine 2-epimerase (non-hydrolyzing) [Pseudohongiellaceae bacterium]